MKLAKWLENYWYYYKWRTLGAVFILFVITVVVVSTVTAVSPDYKLLLITKTPMLASQRDEMSACLAGYGKDLNGDGKIKVDIVYADLSDLQPYKELTANQALLASQLMLKDWSLIVTDDACRDYVIQNNMSKGSIDGYSPDGDVKSAWNWENSALFTRVNNVIEVPSSLWFFERSFDFAGLKPEKRADQKTLKMIADNHELLMNVIQNN